MTNKNAMSSKEEPLPKFPSSLITTFKEHSHKCAIWQINMEQKLEKELNALPHVDIDKLYAKWESFQIANWKKTDGFNSFIMGYMLRAKEFLEALK